MNVFVFQHVSMYHRNKVHTDEFWKYELSKHRRTVLDNETNEDLWQRQLGKHAMAGEALPTGPAAASLLHEIDPNHEDKWLDQIKRSAEVSDMKLLALRSLRSSLQFMSTPAAAAAAAVSQPSFRFQPEQPTPPSRPREDKNDEFVPTKEDGYLAMLANVSFSRLEGSKGSVGDWSHQAPTRQSTSTPHWEVLRDMQEEPAAKRTQMWLAQLGQYRHKDFQDELDRSHDELWEEQIARAKQSSSNSTSCSSNNNNTSCSSNNNNTSCSSNNNTNTTTTNVRSSIEAVEITIDDDDDDEAKAVEKKSRPPRLLPMMMSALQVHPAPPPPPPPALSPIASRGPSPQRVTLTLHTSEGESQGSSPRRVPAFYAEDTNNNNNNNNVAITRHVPLATPPLPQRSLPIPIPRSHNNNNNNNKNSNNILKSENSAKSQISHPTDSVLKSLLLESSSRKRPISPTPPPPTAASKPFPVDETDILRRRLLGLPDLESVPAAKPVQKFSPPSATITSKDAERLATFARRCNDARVTPEAMMPAGDNGNLLQKNFIESLRNNFNQGVASDARVDAMSSPSPRLIVDSDKVEKTSYKTTSVLKHLLHRYNADASDNGKKEI